MKQPQPAPKAKLILALMYKEKAILEKAKEDLIKKLGNIERESSEYPFNLTDYYEPEMGKPLYKKFISFKKLVNREKLGNIRLKTSEIENNFAIGSKRTINIDPGYITQNSLVLASVKERPHKIYLGKGIYADLNLILKKEGCFDFPWTFPDYKLEQNQEFFHDVRKDLLNKQKESETKKNLNKIKKLMKTEDEENP